MLQKVKSVISGSVAMTFFEGWSGWEPWDMDVYVPSFSRDRMLWCFKNSEGYDVVQEEAKNKEDYVANIDIEDVISLARGGMKIDLVVSSTFVNLLPVFCFHSTAVINFISGDGFFSAYPVLTEERRSLINANHYTLFQYTTLHSTSVQGYLKYIERGYNVQMNPRA
ncbi:hypothetical protein SERLA73DRAFT_79782 [Serpula lacrymans var. lacrymans S7.3]|uniref:Uncharacterized protein n=2 Tax=Serpula lacrymans var. lacrymans TaxID=341189 RepID=F8QHJ9_SERL3|nr:hypothetical protein SERLA73DRAFT_79782 [Serpula lacrymans var. lacrymans S7.3]